MKILNDFSHAVIIELGAGKGNFLSWYSINFLICTALGGLSHYLVEKYSSIRQNVHFILLDRSNSRRKQDSKLKILKVNFDRVFIDLKDADLGSLINTTCKIVFFVAKHLCGSATCMALRSIVRLQNARPDL